MAFKKPQAKIVVKAQRFYLFGFEELNGSLNRVRARVSLWRLSLIIQKNFHSILKLFWFGLATFFTELDLTRIFYIPNNLPNKTSKTNYKYHTKQTTHKHSQPHY